MQLWEQCPAKYKYEKIDKLPAPKSEAMQRGIRIHMLCESYIKGKDPNAVPPELHRFKSIFPELHALQPVVEQQWGFTDKWKPTGWFSRGANATWLRVVPDCVVLYEDDTAELIDYKTGKPWGDNEDQMDLFGTALLSKYSHVNEVSIRLWYLDTGEEKPSKPWIKNRKTLADSKKRWNERVAPMFADTEFKPTPNSKCNWCPYSNAEGGPCKYG